MKSGTTGGAPSITGGSRYAQPAGFSGGRNGKVDYFVTGQFLRNVSASRTRRRLFAPVHDRHRPWVRPGQVSTLIDEQHAPELHRRRHECRLSDSPTCPSQVPNFNVLGVGNWNSGALDQRQWEKSYFAIASLQKSYDARFQLSGFARYSALYYQADPMGDLLLYNGIAPWTNHQLRGRGSGATVAWKAAKDHTLRGGFLVQRERSTAYTAGNAPAAGADPDDPGRADPVRPAAGLHRRLRRHRAGPTASTCRTNGASCRP